MDSKAIKFSARKKRDTSFVYIITYSIWIALDVFSFFQNRRTHSIISLIAMIFILLFVITIISFEIYAHYIRKKKDIPDITIDEEEITIPYSIFKSPKIIYIDQIADIHVPKWDDVFEIKLKDNSKIKVNLNGFLEEDKTNIKDIFKNIEQKLSGDDLKPDKFKKSYHLVNGKQYIKKERE